MSDAEARVALAQKQEKQNMDAIAHGITFAAQEAAKALKPEDIRLEEAQDYLNCIKILEAMKTSPCWEHDFADDQFADEARLDGINGTLYRRVMDAIGNHLD